VGCSLSLFAPISVGNFRSHSHHTANILQRGEPYLWPLCQFSRRCSRYLAVHAVARGGPD